MLQTLIREHVLFLTQGFGTSVFRIPDQPYISEG
jgi:hypothetical protein